MSDVRGNDKDKVFYLRGMMNSDSRIISVGGGKGGVGKSFFSSGLAIFIANLGYDTLLIDLDLGAANLHTCIGEDSPPHSIHDFLTGKVANFESLAVQTGHQNLRFISGSNDSYDMANITEDQKTLLMSSIFHTKADFIILDLSAGTHSTTLDLFLMATHQLITVTPDPSSVENAYRFIKSAFFRKMKRFEFQLNLGGLISQLMANKSQNGIRSPADLLFYVSRQDPENGERLRNLMESMKIQIVLNQVRTMSDVTLGPSIESVCRKYFGIKAQFLGHIDYDNAVWQSLRKKKHLLLEYPHSRIYAQMLGIARNIVGPRKQKAVV